MTTFGPVLQALLGLAYILQAAVIAGRPRRLLEVLRAFPRHIAARLPFSAVFVLAGAVLLAGIGVPFLNFFGAALAGVLAIAIFGMLLRAKLGLWWPWPVVLLAASLGAVVVQPLGLKVLMLPKADVLPYAPVAARVVKTYDAGVWFEGVSAGADGTLYLAANIGLDFATSDYFAAAHGEVIARKPDGTETTLFTTPVGSAAGVLAVAADGTLFMSSNGVQSGIWRITKDGKGELFAPLPKGAWPNGLDFGPDGQLYAPDSTMGVIWRVDRASGKAEVAIKDPALLARPFVSLAPGANGLHFIGDDIVTTVSDSTKVLRFRANGSGWFGMPEVIANGIPGDDFAVGKDGSLFITTHPYNTVVRVAPDGTRTIIANESQHIVGATDATFGRTEADKDTLYIATDGGAFTGGPKTRGELVALSPYAAQ